MVRHTTLAVMGGSFQGMQSETEFNQVRSRGPAFIAADQESMCCQKNRHFALDSRPPSSV